MEENEGVVIPLGTGETGLCSSSFRDSHCSHRRLSDVVLLVVKPPPIREQKILIPCEHSTEDTEDALSSDEELLFRPLGPLKQRLLDGMHRMEEHMAKNREFVVSRHQQRRARQTDTLFIDSDDESRNDSKIRDKSFDMISPPFSTVDMVDNEEEMHCDSQNTAYGMEDLALNSTSQQELLHVSPRQSLTCSSTSSNYDHPIDIAVAPFPATDAVFCSDVIPAGTIVGENRECANITPLTTNLTSEIDSNEESNSNGGSNAWCNFVPLKKKGRETEDGAQWNAQRFVAVSPSVVVYWPLIEWSITAHQLLVLSLSYAS